MADLVDYLRDKLDHASRGCQHPRTVDVRLLSDRLWRLRCVDCGHEWLEEPR